MELHAEGRGQVGGDVEEEEEGGCQLLAWSRSTFVYGHLMCVCVCVCVCPEYKKALLTCVQ